MPDPESSIDITPESDSVLLDRRLEQTLHSALSDTDEYLDPLLQSCRPQLKDQADQLLGSTLQGKFDSSDVVQESLLQASTSFSDFRGETLSEFRRWLARILERRAIDYARRYRSKKRDVGREHRSGQDLVESFPGIVEGASTIVRKRELVQRLNELISRVPQEERQLIFWRHSESMSFEEIADRLGWTREKTRRTWYRIIQQLGKELNSNGGD